jgi:hypothetical protein
VHGARKIAVFVRRRVVYLRITRGLVKTREQPAKNSVNVVVATYIGSFFRSTVFSVEERE